MKRRPRALRAHADAIEAGAAAIVPLTSSSTDTLRTTHECAAELRISVATLNRMVKAGKVPWVPVGESKRFDMTKVRAALAATTEAKTSPTLAPAQPAPSGVRCLSRKPRL